MTACRTETDCYLNGDSLTIRLWLQPSLSGAAVSLLVSGLTVDILRTFCDGFMVQRVKLMLSKFLLLWFLLFQCFVCRQNVTCLKRFTRYGHYAGEVEDINLTILFLSVLLFAY